MNETQRPCQSSSDELGCYEFSGGFQCDLTRPHKVHTTTYFDVPEEITRRIIWYDESNSVEAVGLKELFAAIERIYQE